ncbi:MAG TPA: lysylphosphatidylglycerol synthase transmembrane domain-containing protein [Prosthecobacter sp.]|nr:lysylphosphatidylglycerol synthase transmembrane domain-containing protein [Prosthecobacter sp.]HRK16401.1 lysylphosphatidylglycerol synthase transmembrane domain-containing protein [Prosthecobacter sp.]
MKKALVIVLKIAVTTVLLGMIFREHQFTGEILPHLRAMGANWPWALAGLACAGLAVLFAALRWQALLAGQDQRVPPGRVARVTFEAAFFNITSLGALGGDAWRVIALLRRNGAQKLPVMASIMLDHLVGLVSVSIVFLGCGWLVREKLEQLSPEADAVLRGFAVFMAGSLLGILVSVLSFTPRIYAWGESKLPWLLGWPPLKKFGQACDALRHAWRWSLLALGASLVLYLFHFLVFYCGIRAVGGTAPFTGFMAAMPVIDMAAGLPVSVSGLGVREKTFEALVGGLAGLPASKAVAASLAGWLMNVCWGLAGGLLFVRGRGD